MSNWAKLQEDLTGLPVAKRAKYGIHFQKGSEIEAHFVGKPCHYQDGEEWKPIDTSLLATTDGWYSSPHSDVIIHPDGRVRVKNSDYQQFTELPSAKDGKLVGDKIIREFPGGEQHLIMKEDGFREEIHLFKPTFKLEKFIAKTTGNLPDHYKAHPITAEDAEGNSYTSMGDTKAFGEWLDKAIYPVVIDPDFSTQPDAASGQDTYMNKSIPTQTAASLEYLRFGRGGDSQYIYRSLIKFDLSSIPPSTRVSSSSVSMYFNQAVSISIAQSARFYRVLKDWTEAYGCWNNYKAATPWTVAGGRDIADSESSAIGVSSALYGTYGWQVIALSTSLVLEWINGVIANNGMIIVGSNEGVNNSRKNFASSDITDPSLRPIFSVTYVPQGNPKHFMHYARLRG